MNVGAAGVPPARAGCISSFDTVEATPETWVAKQLLHYEDKYTCMDKITLSLTTFNVASKKPPTNLSCALSTKLPDGRPIDIIFCALQEVDMSASALLREETEAALPWVNALADAVVADESSAPESPYRLIAVKQLVGLVSVLFVRKELLPYLDQLKVVTLATGALGTMGNKGGIGIRFRLHLTTICLVNAHLAAHQKAVAKRNEDMFSILSQLNFYSGVNVDLDPNGIPEATTSMNSVYETALLPQDHDLLFVLGDLNYRIDTTYEAAIAMVRAKDIPGLLRHDQLTLEMKNPHSVWQGFCDITPRFNPTYRYDIGTSNYDTSEKKRIPAFTDRVLFWAKDERHRSEITPITVNAFEQVTSSDHKPVRALVMAASKVPVPEEKAKVEQHLIASVEAHGLDHVAAAKTVISATELDFGVQKYHNCGKKMSVFLKNEGQSVAIASVSRRKIMDDTEGMWLRVRPLAFSVLPKTSVEVVIECVLDKAALQFLMKNPPFRGHVAIDLSALLVISVEQGPSHFLECRVSITPSVFGNSLGNIVKLGTSPCAQAYASLDSGSQGDEWTEVKVKAAHRAHIPKEVWYLCHDIYTRGRYTKDIFLESGDVEERRRVMEHLDNCNGLLPQDIASVEAVAYCLLLLLKDLLIPVVPPAFYEAALSAGKAGGKIAVGLIQHQLPPLHANIFVYIIALLKFLLRPENAAENMLTPEVLAQIFSKVFLAPPHTGLRANSTKTIQQLREEAQAEQDAAVKFLLCFLVPTTPDM